MKMWLVILFFFCHTSAVHAASNAVARSATPVLNSAAFSSVFGGTDGNTLKTDRCGQVRELEYIALPGTVFRILGELRVGVSTVYQVDTDEYSVPAGVSLYVDSRFVERREVAPPLRSRPLPSRQSIVDALRSTVGSPYVWGGNVQGGVAELLEMFYRGPVPDRLKSRLILAGLDCSGLLYQATGGWTPRNTSQLVSYGRPVPVATKSAEEITQILEPLDLIVWNGHVVIVLDRQSTIESRLECGKPGNGGVVITPLLKRLGEIMRTRRPVDRWDASGKRRDVFVVRRWIAE